MRTPTPNDIGVFMRLLISVVYLKQFQNSVLHYYKIKPIKCLQLFQIPAPSPQERAIAKPCAHRCARVAGDVLLVCVVDAVPWCFGTCGHPQVCYYHRQSPSSETRHLQALWPVFLPVWSGCIVRLDTAGFASASFFFLSLFVMILIFEC